MNDVIKVKLRSKLNQKQRDELLIDSCLGEIEAIIDLTKKPVYRKTYLVAVKWYNFQKDTLDKLNYKGKINKLPKHRIKEEV